MYDHSEEQRASRESDTNLQGEVGWMCVEWEIVVKQS